MCLLPLLLTVVSRWEDFETSNYVIIGTTTVSSQRKPRIVVACHKDRQKQIALSILPLLRAIVSKAFQKASAAKLEPMRQ